jgi:hypothetical protein
MKYLPKPYVYIVPETAATQMQLDRIDPFCFCTLPEYPPPHMVFQSLHVLDEKSRVRPHFSSSPQHTEMFSSPTNISMR